MIDQEPFLLLNEEALKEIVPAVGQRLALQKKLRELQVSERNTNLLSEIFVFFYPYDCNLCIF
jgi:hypothetical protein